MLNRRLWILFIAFLLGFVALAIRLGKLQIAESAAWQAQLEQYLHRHTLLETYRGTIYDRFGPDGRPINGKTDVRVLARDEPSDELAIDYRAMNLDDTWLKKKATERLRQTGEWGRLPDSDARLRRRREVQAEIAQQIEAIPNTIAQVISDLEGVPPEVVKKQIDDRYDDIRDRIRALRQAIWTRRFEARTSAADGDDESSEAELRAAFERMQLEDEIAAHSIRSNIPLTVAIYFKQHIDAFPGLVVRDKADRNRRAYPFGESAAHLIGTLRSVSPERYQSQNFEMPNLLKGDDPGNLWGYLRGDRMGENGIERLAEEQLRGMRGARVIDLSGVEADITNRRYPPISPVAGRDLTLTLDAALQQDLYNAITAPGSTLMKGEDGKTHFVALVILSMDGDLLATVSYPSFDPNTIDNTRGQLNQDTWRTPLMNRAITGAYHPGSTIKPLLAAAGLTENVLTPDEGIFCRGHFYESRADKFLCTGTHGSIDVRLALAKSCNVYFYTAGQRMGVERLARWYEGYGFGKPTGLELSDGKGNSPKPSELDPDKDSPEALFMAIGQGLVDCTPLQMANAYATMLRGGMQVPPRILRETPREDKRVLNISPQTLAVVRQGMEMCVTEGTARSVLGDFRPRVAGKTGTAQKRRLMFDENGIPVDDLSRPMVNADGTKKLKPDGTQMFWQATGEDNDAWFVGYAPADNPKFIVAAVMEWGGHGGTRAAPMAKEAFQQLQRHGYLPRLDGP